MNRQTDHLASRRRRRTRQGFTMMELLIGMMLLVMILVAAALAMKGAADANAYGSDKARSLSQATLALARLSTDIRRAADVQLVSAHGITLTLPDGQVRQYTWNPTPGDPVVYTSTDHPEGHPLVAEALDFTLQATEAYSEIVDAVVPVTVSVVLEVRHRTATTRLETAVRPRRNIM